MNIKILRRVRRSMTYGIEPKDGTSRTNATVAEPTNTERARFDGATTHSNGTAIAVARAQPLTGPNNFNAVIEQN
jgi:hypothetical protein